MRTTACLRGVSHISMGISVDQGTRHSQKIQDKKYGWNKNTSLLCKSVNFPLRFTSIFRRKAFLLCGVAFFATYPPTRFQHTAVRPAGALRQKKYTAILYWQYTLRTQHCHFRWDWALKDSAKTHPDSDTSRPPNTAPPRLERGPHRGRPRRVPQETPLLKVPFEVVWVHSNYES